jgi:hypothetical protein
MYKQPIGDFVTSAISDVGGISAVADTMTIGTGLDIPATYGILQIDYDSTEALGAANGPETVTYATYTTATGAVAGMTRGVVNTTGVVHALNAKVQSGPSAAYAKDFIGARAYKSAVTQDNLVNTTPTKVTLDAETYDVGANFASNKFTAPFNGYYHITGTIEFVNAVADKGYVASIYVNNAAVANAWSTNGGYTTACAATVTDTVYLAATDYVELFAISYSGDNTVDINNGSANTYLSIHLVKEV